MRLDGKKVLMSRAPMTTPSVSYIRVIDDNHPMADLIEDSTVYISPIANYPDAGDCDGDIRSFCYAEDSTLSASSFNYVVDNIVERTGSDQLLPGGTYWGDHFNIPSAKDIENKRGLSAKNLSLDICPKDLKHPKARKSLPGMLEGSTQMFQEAVGWMHLLFLTTDVYLNLLWSLEPLLKEWFPEWEPEEWTRNKSLVLILAELYEVPLGGLSWEAYDVIFGFILPILKGQNVRIDLEAFKEALNKAGMNGSAASDIRDAAHTVCFCQRIEKLGESLKTPDLFLQLTTNIFVMISKGQFMPQSDVHYQMMNDFMSWIEEFDPDHKMVNQSITISQCWEYCKTVGLASNGFVVEIDLDYF